MARGLRRDHGDVNAGGRLDGAETNVEAVGEHERFPFGEMWLDLVGIELRLLGVGGENHDYVSPFGGLRGRIDREAFFFGFGAGGAAFGEADAHAHAAVTKIERMRVTLGSVTDDRDFL